MVTEAVAIRPLQPAELAAYKGLRDHMLYRHADAFTSDATQEASRSAASYRFRLAQPSGEGTLFTLCAWWGPSMVGAVSCERDARARVAHIGHVVGMMVLPQAQGRGIGQALLQAALNLARADSRLEQLTLTVTANNRGAVQLYQRAGFQRYGTLPRALKLPPGQAGGTPSYLDKDLMVCPLK